LERYANKFWSKPVFAIAQERETAIEIAATHANSILAIVESNSRRNHKIEFSGLNQKTARWLPQTETISLKFRFRVYSAKHHF
jgi:hypothetical protein